MATLAQAHDVSKKTIYRALDEHDIEYTELPSHGTARWFWNTHLDAVPGDD